MKPYKEGEMNHKIVEQGEITRGKVYVFVVGVVTGMALTVWLMREPVVDERQERAMVNACKFPRVNGAMTVITMIDDKFTCWVWQ
jgi:hypothetical protein